MTVGIDLESGQILWVATGRGAAALRKFLRRLRLARAKVAGSPAHRPPLGPSASSAVACDRRAAYWSASLEGRPKARVVFDHFHILKLAKERSDEVRRGLQREAGILERRDLQGKRELLRMGEENLPAAKRAALAEALRFNAPLSLSDDLKEELRARWSQPNWRAARTFWSAGCAQAMESALPQRISLAKRGVCTPPAS